MGVAHQGHPWYFTDIFHWWMRCMLIYCQEGTNFHLYFLLMHQPGWYTSHTHYFGIEFVAQIHLFRFISDGLHLQDLLWWGMEKYDSRRWDIIPFLGRDDHNETAWCILSIDQLLFSTPPSGILIPYFPCLFFLNASASSFNFVCVENSLFPK